ncbi:hypothetical protein BC628DRAFT_961843 [Trametes gibbosa]|nr:hypothetical protein BC628DRAFT_961843 [Trametes gibbosa]
MIDFGLRMVTSFWSPATRSSVFTKDFSLHNLLSWRACSRLLRPLHACRALKGPAILKLIIVLPSTFLTRLRIFELCWVYICLGKPSFTLLYVCDITRRISALMPTEPTFGLVSACIRLGRKYEIKQIYDTALAILKNHYTDDFDHWDSLGNGASCTSFDDVHSIGVVNLVRLIGDHTMLPVALWQCCRLGSHLVHGFARADGTTETLTLEDLGLCFAAQQRLIQAGVRARLRIFAPTVSEGCRNPAKCKDVFAKANKTLEKRADVLAGTDPFVPYTKVCFEGVLGLCSACSSEVKARDKKERRAIWNRLPTLLGIVVPGWGSKAE